MTLVWKLSLVRSLLGFRFLPIDMALQATAAIEYAGDNIDILIPEYGQWGSNNVLNSLRISSNCHKVGLLLQTNWFIMYSEMKVLKLL